MSVYMGIIHCWRVEIRWRGIYFWSTNYYFFVYWELKRFMQAHIPASVPFINIYIYIYIYMTIYLSVCLSVTVCVSAWLYVCPCVCLSLFVSLKQICRCHQYMKGALWYHIIRIIKKSTDRTIASRNVIREGHRVQASRRTAKHTSLTPPPLYIKCLLFDRF